LNAKDIETETVDVPEWGGAVMVRALTGSERDSFEAGIIRQNGKKVSRDLNNIRAKLCAACIIDEAGKRIFSEADIQALGVSDTVAVSLTPTPFGLGHCEYTPAQKIIASNGILAIASDLNPGTAWCESMQFVIALSCRYLKITVAQAIAAATINAAAATGRADQIGSLEPGKQADLLVLSVDDYRNLGYKFGGNLVQRVMKRGHWVVENK